VGHLHPGIAPAPEREEGDFDLLRGYERIAARTRDLLEATQAGDWDAVETIEEDCRELIAQVRMHSGSRRLAPGENRRRIELLRAILADDARIRRRLEPWLTELEQYLGLRAPGSLQARP